MALSKSLKVVLFLVALIIVVAGIVLLTGLMATTRTKTTASVQTNSTNSTTGGVTPTLTMENSLTVGQATVFFVHQLETDPTVSVYLKKNGTTTEIIPDVLYDLPGGSNPTLQATTVPNLVRLKTGTGDSGGVATEDYYINVSDGSMLKVAYWNAPAIEVTTATGDQWTVDPVISDSCGTGETPSASATAQLSDLIVNDQPAKILKQPITLACLTPELGPFYSPAPDFVLQGVSQDLSTLFFSLVGQITDDRGVTKTAWIYSYSLSLKTGAVVEGLPANLL